MWLSLMSVLLMSVFDVVIVDVCVVNVNVDVVIVFVINVNVRFGIMATRMASRYISSKFSSGGKVLGEEEKAAENVYIKKFEQEKLQKLAQKGLKGDEKPGAASSETVAGSVAKAAGGAESSSKPGVSNDKFKNYAVVAGLVTALGAGGWWYLSKDKKAEEVRD